MFLEIFNLLNSDDLRIVSFQPTAGGSGLSSGDIGVGSQRLQLDATRRFGRRYQVGFQFNFQGSVRGLGRASFELTPPRPR